MGVVVHPGRLREEMTRRGWAAVDLARNAGISPPTVSAALAGRAISAQSVRRIGTALMHAPTIEAIDSLIFREDRSVLD